MSEKVLTIKELAEALQVTEQHLYRELREPDCKIPVSMIGKSKRFLLSEVLSATKTNNRKDILLKATYDLLKKCDDGPYVKNVLEETSFYDETNCDGFCLMEDIASLLGIEDL